MNWLKRILGIGRQSVVSHLPETELKKSEKAKADFLRSKYGHHLRRAFHLRNDSTRKSSKLGGQPNLPSAFEWPSWKGKPQSFLAQIDLAEIHRIAPTYLPQSGYLYFFYDQDQSVWGFDPKDLGGWRVLYFDGEIGDVGPRNFPDGLDDHAKFRVKNVGFSLIETLPSSPEGLDWKTEGDAYDEMCRAPFEGLPPHQILGWPRPVQGDDMELECQLASNGVYVGNPEGYRDPRRPILEPGASEWKLLLQLDTDDETGWMWGDVGTIYFWIKEDDARRCDFSKVWMVFQCS